MKNLFKVPETNRVQRQQYKLNLQITKSNQLSFGTKSPRIQGPKVWNTLPFHIKSKENLQAFKASEIRQKGESQNGCFKKAKHAKISEKQTFLTLFAFLKHPF